MSKPEYLLRIDDRRLAIELKVTELVGAPWMQTAQLPADTSVDYGLVKLGRMRAEHPERKYRLVELREVHNRTREVLS